MPTFIAMAMFSFTMSFSPGPVNFLALASGLNVGLRKSLGFVLGASIGFVSLLFLTGYGIGKVAHQLPMFLTLLKVSGCLFIGFMGVQTLRAHTSISSQTSLTKPLSFGQGWWMQWLNPKAWIACLAGCAAFNVYSNESALIQFVAVYFVICVLGIGSWAYLGNTISRWIRSPKHVILFNRVMGITLIALGVLMLFS